MQRNSKSKIKKGINNNSTCTYLDSEEGHANTVNNQCKGSYTGKCDTI